VPKGRGLQAERTALSWSRAALLLTVNAIIMARAGWVYESLFYGIVAVALFVAALAAVLYGGLRKRRLLADASPVAASASVIAVMTAVTFLACAVGVYSILVLH
jgi:hypothetical protein